MKKYNVWNNQFQRWTNYGGQSSVRPPHLPLDEAINYYKTIIAACPPNHKFKIREVRLDNNPGSFYEPQETSSCIDTGTAAVMMNDHTCHVCKNNRLSKVEKSCWKCGEPVMLKRA